MDAIVTRAPMRVSLGGGGTDLPSWYREHGGGFVVSAAIDKYVHVVVSTGFQPRFRLKHLEWEEVDDPAEVRHPILREALRHHWTGEPLELASVSDAPPGTGLGSSGSYAVCVLKALRLASGSDLGPADLAEAACELEIDVLGRAVGKQDQYAAAHGGARTYTFHPDGRVEARRLELSSDARLALREEFLLFYTGTDRSASDVLSHQVSGTLAGDLGVRANLERARELARESCAALEAGDLVRLGELMEEHWEVKRARAPGAVTRPIEDLRALALRSGAHGVALMGAGGGGFLLVCTRDPERTRRAMTDAGAPELVFDLDEDGCVAIGR